jgi:hypothetical protein
MQLWELRKSTNETLPVLNRTGNKPSSVSIGETVLPTKIYSGITVTDPIDVVRDFNWTKSPNTSRNDVPYIQLKEKRLLMNSNVSNIANAIFAGGGSVKPGINTISAGINAVVAAARITPADFSRATNQGIIGAVIAGTTGLTVEEFTAAASQNTLATSVNNFFNNNFQTFESSVLKPYEYLYATEPTGFNYRLPYFENEYVSSRVAFGADGSALSSLSDIVMKGASGIAGIMGGLQSGTYIERAKQFTMGESGRRITVNFPLLNTGTYQDILDNWQLIFGLLYQNKPGRVTRAIIDMPVIYEVLIPGVVYMPYAYISDFSVNFLGARRTMEIDVPIYDNSATVQTKLTTTIPDAYSVSMTIEGMNDETRNMLYANITSGPVTTKSS